MFRIVTLVALCLSLAGCLPGTDFKKFAELEEDLDLEAALGSDQSKNGDPRGIPPLSDYSRYYSHATEDGRRVIVGDYQRGRAAPGIYRGPPETFILDGGCGVVRLVFDAEYVERYPIGPRLPGQPVPDWVVRADSLEQLAGLLDLPGDALCETVARFNAHAAAGHDPDFERGTSAYDHFYGDRSRDGAAVTLGPVARAPFYAVEIRMGLLGTNGGPRTDGAARILGHDGAPIAGLYGAGNAIACPTGGIYAGAGGTLGPALTFGYIAGRSAARANA